jgi:uncharacterized protein YfcZ (UPF0381/DUF406 family)
MQKTWAQRTSGRCMSTSSPRWSRCAAHPACLIVRVVGAASSELQLPQQCNVCYACALAPGIHGWQLQPRLATPECACFDCHQLLCLSAASAHISVVCAMLQVTDEKMDSFYNQYRGSEEEKCDLLRHFKDRGGDMKIVFEFVMCSDPDLDSHRFRDAVDSAIEAGEVETSAKYTKWRKELSKKKAPKDPLKPKKTAQQARAEDGDAALVAMIQKKMVRSPLISNIRRSGVSSAVLQDLRMNACCIDSETLSLHCPCTEGRGTTALLPRAGCTRGRCSSCTGEEVRWRRQRRRWQRWRRHTL